jgi:hypothetical protein
MVNVQQWAFLEIAVDMNHMTREENSYRFNSTGDFNSRYGFSQLQFLIITANVWSFSRGG